MNESPSKKEHDLEIMNRNVNKEIGEEEFDHYFKSNFNPEEIVQSSPKKVETPGGKFER